jgi:hypothetical protein
MMIKAKITVFDDETGQVLEKDKVIEPYRDETTIRSGFYYSIEDIEFRFEVHRIKDGHSCINCKHFSCNKPMPYCDNRVSEYCTLHPDEEDAYGYCDDYEDIM